MSHANKLRSTYVKVMQVLELQWDHWSTKMKYILFCHFCNKENHIRDISFVKKPKKSPWAIIFMNGSINFIKFKPNLEISQIKGREYQIALHYISWGIDKNVWKLKLKSPKAISGGENGPINLNSNLACNRNFQNPRVWLYQKWYGL